EQTVTHTTPLLLEAPPGTTARSVFEGVPHFVPVEQPMVFMTATKVTAGQVQILEKSKEVNHEFPAKDGKVEVRWPAPGWWTLTAGKEQRDIFVYGGTTVPHATRSAR